MRSPLAERCSMTLRFMGTKGALIFSYERFNELHFYSSADTAGRTGFRKIEAGPDQSPHGRFCVAPGHQLGSTTSKRSRSRAISTPSQVSARNPSISGWVFAFRPSLRRSKNRGRQRAGWMSKMADKLSRRGDASRPACRAQKLRSHEARKRALRIGRGKFS
jgi:hypothetical protein